MARGDQRERLQKKEPHDIIRRTTSGVSFDSFRYSVVLEGSGYRQSLLLNLVRNSLAMWRNRPSKQETFYQPSRIWAQDLSD